MRVATPQEITEGLLTTNVAMDDEPAWNAGTYNVGDRVLFDRQIWRATTTTTDKPDAGALKDPATWVRMGWSNRWRMFKDGIDSQTVATGDIDVTIIQTGNNSVLAALGLQGFKITMQILSGEIIEHEEEVLLTDFLVDNAWDWFFKPYDVLEEYVFDIPAGYAASDVRLLLESFDGATEVKAGRVLLGRAEDIGVTLYGTSLTTIGGGQRERDEFGSLILGNRRRTIRLLDYKMIINTSSYSNVASVLERLDGVPTLFIGSDKPEFGATIVFGVIAEFRPIISGPQVCDCTLTVERF